MLAVFLGEAEAILLRARATGAGIEAIAGVLKSTNVDGNSAVSLIIAEKYMDAFGSLAKSSTTLMLPGGASSPTSDPASFVAQAMAVYNNVKNASPSSKS